MRVVAVGVAVLAVAVVDVVAVVVLGWMVR